MSRSGPLGSLIALYDALVRRRSRIFADRLSRPLSQLRQLHVGHEAVLQRLFRASGQRHALERVVPVLGVLPRSRGVEFGRV